MKKWLLLGLIVVLVLLVYWYSRAEPISIQAVQVDHGDVTETVANTRSGSVMACRRSKLSVSVGGQISQVKIKEGDKVVAGQLLLTLFNQDIQAILDQALAHLTAVAPPPSAAIRRSTMQLSEATSRWSSCSWRTAPMSTTRTR